MRNRNHIKWCLIFLGLNIVLFCWMSSFVYGNPSKERSIKAVIYYIGWDIETRYPLTPMNVRENYWIKINIENKSEIDAFIKLLKIDHMTESNKQYFNDFRLVVDLIDSNDKHISYYATKERLFTENGEFTRIIDSKFRDRFSFIENAK